MQTVNVRPASSGDAVWAAALMASSDPWVTLGRGFDACYQACTWTGDVLEIAELDGERCGFVLVRPSGVAGAPYVKSIAVSPDHRSRGVGAVLLAHVERAFEGRARHLFLCVSSFNGRAKRFYERLGYAAVGVIEDFLIDGADEVLMYKRLRDPGASA